MPGQSLLHLQNILKQYVCHDASQQELSAANSHAGLLTSLPCQWPGAARPAVDPSSPSTPSKSPHSGSHVWYFADSSPDHHRACSPSKSPHWQHAASRTPPTLPPTPANLRRATGSAPWTRTGASWPSPAVQAACPASARAFPEHFPSARGTTVRAQQSLASPPHRSSEHTKAQPRPLQMYPACSSPRPAERTKQRQTTR
mmetsp:Transcript_40280/g.105804  ORF Transcript_40280/g.105804 Transcript_40280/m.105804 type:complete len:200 (-) Transcript_40280:1102-1701(-)